MATQPQQIANRENARHSTGPRTPEGRARSSQNALRFGLFSTQNCVQPHETGEYEALSFALWNDLLPQGSLQELFAAEIVRAAWRLRRCVEVEAALAERSLADPALDSELLRVQTAVDRARSQAHGILRRSLNELRRLQSQSTPPVPTQDENPAPEPPAKPTQSQAPPPAPIPRNAACPCRSGQKYKRCCGRNAPALLHQAA